LVGIFKGQNVGKQVLVIAREWIADAFIWFLCVE
jgi:hypothetical protein